jgi:hypothetical protein
MNKLFYVNGIIPSTISFNGNNVNSVFYNGNWVWGKTIEELIGDFNGVVFASTSGFSVFPKLLDRPVGYDGVLECSKDMGLTWRRYEEMDNMFAYPFFNDYYILCFRGTGNTTLTNFGNSYWTVEGSNVRCIGNIETLLDYQTVAAGGHPAMAEGAFSGMFKGWSALIEAPQLPATELADGCYSSMFYNCEQLTAIPALPATKLPEECYYAMFASNNIKFSETQTEEYKYEYRIPSNGEITEVGALAMFGMFGFTPEPNKTYYTNATILY